MKTSGGLVTPIRLILITVLTVSTIGALPAHAATDLPEARVATAHLSSTDPEVYYTYDLELTVAMELVPVASNYHVRGQCTVNGFSYPIIDVTVSCGIYRGRLDSLSRVTGHTTTERVEGVVYTKTFEEAATLNVDSPQEAHVCGTAVITFFDGTGNQRTVGASPHTCAERAEVVNGTSSLQAPSGDTPLF